MSKLSHGETVVDNTEQEYECDLFIAPSFVGGRGIFAGRSFQSKEIIDVASSMTINQKKIHSWPINNYVYGSDDDHYSMALFGVAMLFNHRNPKDVEHKWEEWPVPSVSKQRYEAHTVYTQVSHETTRSIELGEEIFTSYGGDEWFSSREIHLNSSVSDLQTKYTLDELRKVGYCMTHVEVRDSELPLAGRGLFAKRAFKKDEIVAISPVLVVPKHGVEEMAEESVLLNFCMTTPESDVALVPIGYTAMANHGGDDSNLALSWFAWDGQGQGDFSAKLKMTGDALVSSPFAQLDLSYRATRDIAAGEELTFSYSEGWEIKWVQHLDKLSDWLQESFDSEEESLRNKPVFRTPIGSPDGLFPKWWRVACIGKGCQMRLKQDEIDKDPVLKQKQQEARLKAQDAIERARAAARKHHKKQTTGTGSCKKSSTEPAPAVQSTATENKVKNSFTDFINRLW